MRTILQKKEPRDLTEAAKQGSHGQRWRQLLFGNMQEYGGPVLLAFSGKEREE